MPLSAGMGSVGNRPLTNTSSYDNGPPQFLGQPPLNRGTVKLGNMTNNFNDSSLNHQAIAVASVYQNPPPKFGGPLN